MFLRLLINVAVITNMNEMLKNKLKDQYGVGVQDSLLLIVQSFDRYCYFKNIINNGLISMDNYNMNYYNPDKLKQIIHDFNKENNIENGMLENDNDLDNEIIDLLSRN